MNKRETALLISFSIISSLILFLGVYLVAAKANFHPQLFITTCGEVLNNIWEHTHLNSEGLISLLVLLIFAIGVSLGFAQVVRFVFSHQQLSAKASLTQNKPKNLEWIINKHNLGHITFIVTGSKQLTAYTTGLIKPVIVVSKSLTLKTNRNQLEAIILHEFYHVKNRHTFLLLVTRMISALLFFIPLIKYLGQQLKTEFEIAADLFVVQKQNTRYHICSSLVLNLKDVSSVVPHFATSPIEKRVESLVNKKISLDKVGNWQLGISLLSFVLMMGLVIIKPNGVTAILSVENNLVCGFERECFAPDCIDDQSIKQHNFTPLVPISLK